MSENVLDELNLRILEHLQDDGRRSYREIGEQLGVAPGTVRTRVLQMVEDGIVEIVAVPNPWRLGLTFLAVVGLRLQPEDVAAAADMLTDRHEVSWIGLTASTYQLMCEVVLADVQEFGAFQQDVLAQLPGYCGADVFVQWQVRKLRYQLNRRVSSR